MERRRGWALDVPTNPLSRGEPTRRARCGYPACPRSLRPPSPHHGVPETMVKILLKTVGAPGKLPPPAIVSPCPAVAEPLHRGGARRVVAGSAGVVGPDHLEASALGRLLGGHHLGRSGSGTHRRRRVLDERRMQEVGGPFAGLCQVPSVPAAKFVAVRAATDQPSHAEPGDFPLGGFPPAPGFPSNHAASLASRVGQRLSDRWYLFAKCQNRHLTLPGAGS